MKNVLENLIGELMQFVDAEVENFSTNEGDRVAVVKMLDMISVGILENNGSIAHGAFTKAEAKHLSDILAKFATS